MRKILLTRGAMGVGKSTWLKQQKMEQFVVSPDDIRLLKAGLTMNDKGQMVISQHMNKHVWKEVYDIVENKMKDGQFIVVDATFQTTRDFDTVMKLSRRYFYDVAVIDFTKVPVDVALERNASRESYKFVPEDVIHRAYERFASCSVPKNITVIEHNDYNSLHRFLVDGIKIDVYNKYNKIHHIGDLQGCFSVFEEYLEFSGGIKDDELYIFVGDYVDRGIENHKVIQWMLNNYTKPNIVFLAGNHELHLMRYACGEKSKSDEFNEKTALQLDSLNVNKRDMYDLCKSFKDIVVWHHGAGYQVVSTHAGIFDMPNFNYLYEIPSQYFWKGVRYADPVDEMWMNNTTQWASSDKGYEGADKFMYQVHGHRNKKGHDIDEYQRSFNLESKVEFGGELSVVVAYLDGFEVMFQPVRVKNNVYNKKAKNKH